MKAYRPFVVQGDYGEPSTPCHLRRQKRLRLIQAWSGSSITIVARRRSHTMSSRIIRERSSLRFSAAHSKPSLIQLITHLLGSPSPKTGFQWHRTPTLLISSLRMSMDSAIKRPTSHLIPTPLQSASSRCTVQYATRSAQHVDIKRQTYSRLYVPLWQARRPCSNRARILMKRRSPRNSYLVANNLVAVAYCVQPSSGLEKQLTSSIPLKN